MNFTSARGESFPPSLLDHWANGAEPDGRLANLG